MIRRLLSLWLASWVALLIALVIFLAGVGMAAMDAAVREMLAERGLL